jgi:hypothetical protein
MPVAARAKSWVYGSSLAGIAGSNPAGSMDVFLLWALSGRGLCDGPITSPGVLASVVCLIKWDQETSYNRFMSTRVVVPWKKNKQN